MCAEFVDDPDSLLAAQLNISSQATRRFISARRVPLHYLRLVRETI